MWPVGEILPKPLVKGWTRRPVRRDGTTVVEIKLSKGDGKDIEQDF